MNSLHSMFKEQKNMVSILLYHKYGFGEAQGICVAEWVYKIGVESLTIN